MRIIKSGVIPSGGMLSPGLNIENQRTPTSSPPLGVWTFFFELRPLPQSPIVALQYIKGTATSFCSTNLRRTSNWLRQLASGQHSGHGHMCYDEKFVEKGCHGECGLVATDQPHPFCEPMNAGPDGVKFSTVYPE
jgi:hypothetical protein